MLFTTPVGYIGFTDAVTMLFGKLFSVSGCSLITDAAESPQDIILILKHAEQSASLKEIEASRSHGAFVRSRLFLGLCAGDVAAFAQPRSDLEQISLAYWATGSQGLRTLVDRYFHAPNAVGVNVFFEEAGFRRWMENVSPISSTEPMVDIDSGPSAETADRARQPWVVGGNGPKRRGVRPTKFLTIVDQMNLNLESGKTTCSQLSTDTQCLSGNILNPMNRL